MQTTLYGTLIATLADTSASHELGGFKIGVGFSLPKCCECLAIDEDIQCKVCIETHMYIHYTHHVMHICLSVCVECGC